MNDKQRRRVERLVRSRDVAASQGIFQSTSAGGKAIAGLTARLAEIDNLEAQRSTSLRASQQGTSNRSAARKALREWLATISDTAATIALDFPEFKDRFLRPRTNINDQNLLGTARSFITEATPLKARFIEYDLPADFLETFTAVVENFEQAINQQNLGKGGHRANSVAIDAALDFAEQDLERLNTVMRNKFGDNPATLAAWESARRLQRAPQKQKPPTPPTPPTA
jgi:hypothetical protein